MKKNSELSSVELQIILLAHCNITVSARTISSQWNALAFSTERVIAFSTERIIAFSMERILVQNAFQLTRNFGVPLAFLQHSISRSICVPVMRSLLGYFCPVLYVRRKKPVTVCVTSVALQFTGKSMGPSNGRYMYALMH